MPGPELRVIGGPADGTTIPLGDEPFVIGRWEEAAGLERTVLHNKIGLSEA